MKFTTTPKADVFLYGNHMVKVMVHAGADMDEKDLLELNAAKHSLVGDNKHVVLFFPGEGGLLSKEGRELAATPELNRGSIAKAIIVNTVAHQLITNFFITVNKPAAPTKSFHCPQEAVEWLNTMAAKSDVKLNVSTSKVLATTPIPA